MEWECREQVLPRQDTNSKSKGRIFRTCSCVRSPCSSSAFMREFLAPEEDDHTLFACPLAEGGKQSRTFLLPFCSLVTGLLLTTVSARRRAVEDDVMTYARAHRRRWSCSQRRASSGVRWGRRREMISLSSSANPSESILSAPSRMRMSNVSNPNEGEFRRWLVR